MLPALGIAVFVYDRRGSGQSGSKNAGGDFTLLADDAVAAAKNLAGRIPGASTGDALAPGD